MPMPRPQWRLVALFLLITLASVFGAAADTALDDDLKLAAIRNETDPIRPLLTQGADPNIEIENGVTPLIMVATFGNAVAADLLVRAGARVDEDGNQGCTALTWAARNGWPQMVGLLIDWGADINHQDKGGG
ncbi:MAG: ankyrin repeat protein [Alphaproteobacteria bacterium]|jgi:ankyrin repeat protein